MIMELYVRPAWARPEGINSKGQFEKGHEPFNKGKKWSDYMDEEKQKMVLKNLSREGRKKGSAPTYAKPVTAYTVEGKYIRTFMSSAAAARHYGLERRNISNCAEGSRKRCGGMMFRFANVVTDASGNMLVKREDIQPYERKTRKDKGKSKKQSKTNENGTIE